MVVPMVKLTEPTLSILKSPACHFERSREIIVTKLIRYIGFDYAQPDTQSFIHLENTLSYSYLSFRAKLRNLCCKQGSVTYLTLRLRLRSA